jgi:hypothetical protein
MTEPEYPFEKFLTDILARQRFARQNPVPPVTKGMGAASALNRAIFQSQHVVATGNPRSREILLRQAEQLIQEANQVLLHAGPHAAPRGEQTASSMPLLPLDVQRAAYELLFLEDAKQPTVQQVIDCARKLASERADNPVAGT